MSEQPVRPRRVHRRRADRRACTGTARIGLTSATACRVATTVGVVTALIGGALVTAPGSAGPLMGLREPARARWVGLLDLGLVPGLVAGRPRWPWMAARAAANLATVAYCAASARGTEDVGRVRVVGLVLTAATLADAAAAVTLRRNRTRVPAPRA